MVVQSVTPGITRPHQPPLSSPAHDLPRVLAWVCCTSWSVLASWRWEQSPQSMALMSLARSGYNGTSDITASAPPPASWPRPGPGLGLRIQSPHDRSPRGQLHGSSLGASVVCPPAEPVLCFQTNSCDDAGSGPPQLHPRGGRPGAGVGRSV